MAEADNIQAFRKEVRSFIAQNLPPEVAAMAREDFEPARPLLERWHAILDAKGWAVPNWPVEHGGTGWTPLQRHVFAEECGRADAPALNGIGLQLVGPLLIRFGNNEQRARLLPGIRSGAEWWCQGFSEPHAGSDLLALTTRAEDCGDHWRVEGRKIWISQAHNADRMITLVRSEQGSRGGNGLTLLMIDMKSPGLSIRPIVTLNRAHHVNEVVLDGVLVPKSEQVGEAGQAWDYARALLQNERAASGHLPRAERHLRRLMRAAGRPLAGGKRPIDDPLLADAILEARMELRALQSAVMTILGEAHEERKRLLASVIKLRGAELAQTLTSLTLRALGPRAMRYWSDPSWPAEFEIAEPVPGDEVAAMGNHLMLRAATIYGGSSEVQRNLIARMALN